MTEPHPTQLYVYGVVGADAAVPHIKGLDDQPLRLVVQDDLAAVVSDIEAGELEPTGARLNAHLERLTQVHHATTVLPMSFGIVLPDEETVREDVLAAHAERLRDLLAAFRGRAELELRGIFDEDTLLRTALVAHPEIREARARLAGKSAEATYYEQIQLGEQIAAAVSELREQVRARMLSQLSPAAIDARVGEPAHELDAYSAAFLVDDEQIETFDELVSRLEAAHGDLVRMKYFGPLPPHSFVELEGEMPAWA